MGYALKLQNVNFSSVAVDRVTFGDEIPCTGIELSQSTITVEKAEGTVQLTATVTPANTTDQVIWSSSNENVATVADGLVTVHGIGTATITATCGAQTDTASVTQTTIKAQYDFARYDGKYPGTLSITGGTILGLSSDVAASTGGQAYHNADDLRVRGNDDNIECVRVPYGATIMKFTSTDENTVTINMIYFVDTNTLLTDSEINYPEYTRRPTSVKNTTGTEVEYGEAFIFRTNSTETMARVGYIYFE